MIEVECSIELVFCVVVLRRHDAHQDLTTQAYYVKGFLNSPLDPLVTLSSNCFNQGKIASECDIIFERYSIYPFMYKGVEYSQNAC